MKRRRLRTLLGSALALAALAGCTGRAADRERRTAPDEFSVMTYNLFRFGYDDRDRDGQDDDFKPEEEIRALVDTIRAEAPDVLAVQEIGGAEDLATLIDRLRQVGLDYPHAETLVLPTSHTHLGLASRFPIVQRLSITNESYSMGSTNLPVSRGYLCADLQVSPAYRFRLVVAHLKSKRYHPLGQTEMRRNEARLLNKHVRAFLRDEPDLNLLVVGDMNDTINSEPLQVLMGGDRPVLRDLRPADRVGDVWTHFWAYQDSYDRIDFMLASEGMAAEVVTGKCRVVRSDLVPIASDHRPVVAVFKANEQPARP